MTITWCMVPEISSVTDRIFLSFWTIFCPFFLENCKKHGDIIILHRCTKNHDHMLYYFWDILCDRCSCYFSFWAIFCPFTTPPSPLTAQKITILKKWKKTPGDIIILHVCTRNYDQMMYGSWGMVQDRRTDRQTDGWTEKVTYRGGCPT